MGILGGKARSINVVSVSLGLLLVAAVYLGWKFIPVYWQAQKVDNALEEVKWEASKLELVEDDPREQKLLDRLYDDVLDLGVDERYLEVYFDPDYSAVHADYTAFVRYPFGKVTTLEFHRSLDIPRDDF